MHRERLPSFRHYPTETEARHASTNGPNGQLAVRRIPKNGPPSYDVRGLSLLLQYTPTHTGPYELTPPPTIDSDQRTGSVARYLLPSPLSQLYAKFRSGENDTLKYDYALALAEGVLRFFAILLVAEAASTGRKAAKVRRWIDAFTQSTPGKMLGIIEGASSLLRDAVKNETHTAFMPDLLDSVHSESTSWKKFDQIVQHRNARAHGRESLSNESAKRRLDQFAPLLKELLDETRFLRNYHVGTVTHAQTTSRGSNAVLWFRRCRGTEEDAQAMLLEADSVMPEHEALIINNTADRYLVLNPLLVRTAIQGRGQYLWLDEIEPTGEVNYRHPTLVEQHHSMDVRFDGKTVTLEQYRHQLHLAHQVADIQFTEGSKQRLQSSAFPELFTAKFKEVALIGEGGMSRVYEVEQRAIKQPRALKVLKAEFSTHPRNLERFRREAQTLMDFNHPRLVKAYDLDVLDGRPYICMELLEGESLKNRLLNGPMAPRSALRVLQQVLEGLDYIHARHVLHRDLKSSNVMICTDGVKIIDFGVAKALHSTDLTQTGTYGAAGTERFMAPEQFIGEATERSDIYAAGLLFACMLGRRNQAPCTPLPIDDLEEVSATMVELYRKATQQDQVNRFQTAKAMLEAVTITLKEALPDHSQPEMEQEAERRATREAVTDSASRSDGALAVREMDENNSFPPSTRITTASALDAPRFSSLLGALFVSVSVGLVAWGVYSLFFGLTLALLDAQETPAGWLGWLLAMVFGVRRGRIEFDLRYFRKKTRFLPWTFRDFVGFIYGLTTHSLSSGSPTTPSDAETSRNMATRVRAMAAIVTLCFLVLIAKSTSVIMFPDARLQTKTNELFNNPQEIKGRRGDILTADGQKLATSAAVQTLWADTSMLTHESAVALSNALGPILGLDVSRTIERLTHPHRVNVLIAQNLVPAQISRISERVDALTTTHPSLEKVLSTPRSYQRFYHAGKAVAPLLGVVGHSGTGLSGLERSMEHHLAGETIEYVPWRDRKGQPITNGQPITKARPGQSITLTIDSEIQKIAEAALDRVMERSQPDSVSAVVINPETGAIIALAQRPTHNPNEPRKLNPRALKNRAVTDAFEPGSVFKPFVVAAAFEERLVSSETPIHCENGRFRIGRSTITDDHPEKIISVSEVIKYSSNIGTTKLAFSLGAEKTLDYLQDFGFGARTDIGLRGEAKGFMRAAETIKPIELATTSYGHGVTATAVQLASAMATLANDGIRMDPYMIAEIQDATGVPVRLFEPQIVKRVVSDETARETLAMMATVTEEGGTGTRAAIPGFSVAGKTGTAWKHVDGAYSDTARIGSFIGAVPADDPQLAMAIVVDNPTKGSRYGGQTAGPAFAEIGGLALELMGVAPDPKLMFSQDRAATQPFDRTNVERKPGTTNDTWLAEIGQRLTKDAATAKAKLDAAKAEVAKLQAKHEQLQHELDWVQYVDDENPTLGESTNE